MDGGSSTADKELLDVPSLGGDRYDSGEKDGNGRNVVGQDAKMTWQEIKNVLHSWVLL